MAGQLSPISNKTYSSSSGFTIVELLIVIVVIGILAAVTIVAFNGITKKANDAVAASEAATALQKLNGELVTSDAYPSSLAALGLQNGGGTTYQYSYDNTANPKTFCVTVIKNGSAYFIKQDNTTSPGLCPGHSINGVTAPAVTDYYDFTTYVDPANGSQNLTSVPMPIITDGSWMIIVVAYTNATDAVTPAGWTTLYPRITAGTLRTMVFGKIKASSDPSTFSITGLGGTTANGVLLWGTGAKSTISNWITGSIANRDGTTTQEYITRTPTLTTTTDQSLVLSMSTERTITSETDISSLTGATKWFFVPQPNSNKIQTITVSYATVASAGASSAVTVTYPNLQTVNGTAFQIALPPT